MGESNEVERTNGHDERGRFVAGNPGGPGNPYVRRVAEIRAALLDAVSLDDLRAVVVAVVEKAKAGDVAAAREIFDRLMGKPTQDVRQEITGDGGPIILRWPEVILDAADCDRHMRAEEANG